MLKLWGFQRPYSLDFAIFRYSEIRELRFSDRDPFRDFLETLKIQIRTAIKFAILIEISIREFDGNQNHKFDRD